MEPYVLLLPWHGIALTGLSPESWAHFLFVFAHQTFPCCCSRRKQRPVSTTWREDRVRNRPWRGKWTGWGWAHLATPPHPPADTEPSRDLAQLSSSPPTAERSPGEDWSSGAVSYCCTLLTEPWSSLHLSCSKVHPCFSVHPPRTENTISLTIFHTLEEH